MPTTECLKGKIKDGGRGRGSISRFFSRMWFTDIRQKEVIPKGIAQWRQ
jgi:hypothetical protein